MTLKHWTLAAALAAAALATTGCARYYYGGGQTAAQAPVDLVERNQEAADALLKQVKLEAGQPVLVTAVAPAARPGESSRLGQLIADHVASRLAQRGLPVVREAAPVQAVVSGTYTVTRQAVFVHLQLVRPQGGAALAAHDYVLPQDGTARDLLSK